MKNLLALFLSILLCGCVVPQPTSPPPAERTYDATKAVVWPRLVSAIEGDYPVKVVDKETGLITTDFVLLPSGFSGCEMIRWVYPPDFSDCQMIRSVDPSDVMLPEWAGLRMKLTARVSEPQAGQTRVSIRTQYEAFENSVFKCWVACNSIGSLENDILGGLAP